jgi:phenylalanyl-tRNA synthetase beta chain
MLFSKSWLADYVELPEAKELARVLTSVGLAVDQVEETDGDALLDIDITTNRPDCMNHLGLAREAAVALGRPLRRPEPAPKEGDEPVTAAADIEIEDQEGCPRYAVRVVRGVRIGPSPDWLRTRLQAIGLRSINNVVDVTNFILWETGQPLHAFDLAKLPGGRIVVRRARAGESLVTLDGVERKLDPEMLVIADTERPVALAGVMGGADTEVTDATTDILIESAHFERGRVRSTARALGMHTDASHRFERGTDPEACVWAADRAAALIQEIADGGTVLAGAIDRRRAGFPAPRRGRLDLHRMARFVGVEIPRDQAERWLTGLGFALEPAGADAWDVTVPSWRLYDFPPRPNGAVYEADLFEEAIRHFGFDNIPPSLPALPGSDAPKTEAQIRREQVRSYLAAGGFVEVVQFAFQDPVMDAAYPSLRPGTKPLALANPLSERYSVMRRSLVPNLVETARFNQRRGAASVRMFEIATVFFDQPGAELPDQPEHVGLICGGRPGSPWQRPWDGETELDLFDLKGAVEGIAAALRVRIDARPARLQGLLEGSTAELFRPDGDGATIGYLGRLEAEEGYPLYVAEVALDGLAGGSPTLEIDLPSRFPSVEADLTLTHSVDTPWVEIDRAIAELRPADLVSWSLQVRYRGAGVPEGAVNTTIRFLYNSPERSLTQEEVNERQLALAAELERRYGWKG